MKKIILCADDFSQSRAINRGILRLAEMERLSAVSCLTGSPSWSRDAKDLLACSGRTQLGLHFNLTLPFGLRERSVFSVLAAALSGTIDRKRVCASLDEQWNRFEKQIGRPPDFVDGHQHIHVFPGIREVVVEKIQRSGAGCWVRSLRAAPDFCQGSSKSLLLTGLNRSFLPLLENAGLRGNSYFLGFRPYRPSFDFGGACREWLRVAARNTLIMCHPAVDGDDREDPIRHCRSDEWRYLASEEFETDLRDFRIVLKAESTGG